MTVSKLLAQEPPARTLLLTQAARPVRWLSRPSLTALVTRLATVLTLVFGVSACSTDPCLGTGTGTLVDHSAWTIESASPLPFTDHPAGLACDPTAVVIENGAIEVNTGGCPAANLSQPALLGAEAGDELKLMLWHQPLTAPGTTEASGHMALTIDGVVVWERTVPIPSAGQSYVETVSAPRAFCTGAKVVLHVHNHGSNAWTLRTFERVTLR